MNTSTCAHCEQPLFATIDWPADGIDVCKAHLLRELEALQADHVTGHSWGGNNPADFPDEFFKVTLHPITVKNDEDDEDVAAEREEFPKASYHIETSRFSWSGQDTFDNVMDAWRAVRELVEDDGAGAPWERVFETDEDVAVEYSHISWDPSKPERVMIVRDEVQA